ncbi:hypothetical protein [Vulcanisaeta sp. JCM 14467]|uniref:hypothetical protein n=1 Tax=Vulcanisaeta sp. JCM 14467 TaxID=1295370 RepID=UPI0006D1CB5C|nr:hypothetical protein [Vulcanisaeta sp. JCM 14467]
MIKWFRKKEDEREKLLKCWRRLALMAGTAVSQYTFDSLVNYAKSVKGYVFRGFIEAAKRCDIDDQFLESGELTRRSLSSLASSHDIYMAYADKWMDIAQELEELKNKWLRERYNYYLGYVNAEAVYALGLAILLAGAKAAGKEIDSKAAETALWLSKFSIGRVVESWAIDTVINLLHPLHDSHMSGWAYLVSNTAIIKTTDFIHERLNEIYENIHDLEDWAKAMIAIMYVKMASKVGISANIETHNYDIGTKTYDHNAEIYLNRACSILNEIRDNALKLIASAHVHSYLAVIEKNCLNTDPCGELELISQGLEDLRMEYEGSDSKAFLDNHPGLMKYLEWHSINPETELGDTIKDAWD